MKKIINVATDPRLNIRFEILAWKQLSDTEIKTVLAVFLAKTKPCKNAVYTIDTTIGYDSII